MCSAGAYITAGELDSMSGNRDSVKYCVIVPAHNEEERIQWVVRGARRYCEDVVVIDDGSSDATAEEARKGGAVVLSHGRNEGKGCGRG